MSASESIEQIEPPKRMSERATSVVLLARRQRWALIALVTAVALVIGIGIGRVSAPEGTDSVTEAVELTVLPLALEADEIWTASTEGRPAVSEGLVALRSHGDTTLIGEHLDDWLMAYDTSLVRLSGADLPSVARPIQRQLITATTLSRDAVEVLGHAARVANDDLRTDLITEVGRLRSRSEQLTQSARASLSDLDGSRTDIAPLPELRGFLEGRVSG